MPTHSESMLKVPCGKNMAFSGYSEDFLSFETRHCFTTHSREMSQVLMIQVVVKKKNATGMRYATNRITYHVLSVNVQTDMWNKYA